MSKEYYIILWVVETATPDEIKKAYRKKAMEVHPVIELWIIMDKEDLVDLDEDSSEDLMREILVIFSLHSLVVEWVDEAGDPEQELI